MNCLDPVWIQLKIEDCCFSNLDGRFRDLIAPAYNSKINDINRPLEECMRAQE